MERNKVCDRCGEKNKIGIFHIMGKEHVYCRKCIELMEIVLDTFNKSFCSKRKDQIKLKKDQIPNLLKDLPLKIVFFK